MINVALSGIQFQSLPYITNTSRDDFGQLVKGEQCTVVREAGELWDSDSRPAYSVRLEGCRVGYIPLIETAKEEYIRSKDGYIKVWKEGYEGLTRGELREASEQLIKEGTLPCFHDFKFVGTENSKRARAKLWDKCCYLEMVRDFIYTDQQINHVATYCTVQAMYYDESTRKTNYVEQGEICSIIASFDID